MMKFGWKTAKFKDVSTVVGGSTPKTDIPEYWGGDNYWVAPAELDGSKYISSTVKHITDLAVSKTNLTLLPQGTVLLSSRAPIGKVAITTVPMYCNQGFKNIVCGPELFNGYVYYFLRHNVNYLQSLGTGATFKEISKKVVENVSISYPSLAEQQRIVDELDLLSDIIDKKKAQLRDLDALAKSIFFEMFGEPDEHSNRWKASVVGDCFVSIKNGANIKQSKNAGGIPITRIETLSNGVFNRDRLGYADVYDANKYHSYILVDGDILMSHINSKTYIGRSVVYKYLPGETIIHGMNLLRLIPKNEVLNPLYAKFFFDTVFFKRQVASIRKDAVNQSSMAVGDLKKLRIYLPPIELQASFCEIVSAIERQKAIIKTSIDSSSVMLSSRMDYWFI